MAQTKPIGGDSIFLELPTGVKGPIMSDGSPAVPKVTDGFTGPVPTHAFFTSLAFSKFGDPHSAPMYAHPMTLKATAAGMEIGYKPELEIRDVGYNAVHGVDLTVGLAGLNAAETRLADASDWAATADWAGQMQMTFGKGLPFTYVTRTGDADAVININERPVVSIDNPVDPLTYVIKGVSGQANGEGLKFRLPVDAGQHVGDGAQMRVSYDFNGDGRYDRVETYNFYATDPISAYEDYTEALGLKKTTGAMRDMTNGTIKLEVWQALGTGDITLKTDSADSWIDPPLSGLTIDGKAVDGPLFVRGGATPGDDQSALAPTPGDAPGSDTTFVDETSEGGYAGPGKIWYAEDGVVGLTVNGASYGVFGPTGAQWSFTAKGLVSDLDGKDYFSIAVLPDASIDTLMAYRKHAYAFVTDTSADFAIDKAAGTATTTFDVDVTLKESGGDLSADPLLALYRHQYIASQDELTEFSYTSVRGEMEVLEGSSFTAVNQLDQILPVLPFVGSEADAAELRGLVHESLRGLLENGFTESNDTYRRARELAKYSDLAQIAQQVEYGRARDLLVDEVRSMLNDWFDATDGTGNYFYYDKDWSTLIGYPETEFESTTSLNDQHFHFGYLIYAAATVAQFDPAWGEQHKEMVNELVRSAANWDRGDSAYDYLRTFDPYAGHSWASGHSAFAAGGDQESASESLNFAAAVARWGAVTGQTEIETVGLYLHAVESEAVEQYWWDVDEKVFPEGFEPNGITQVWGDGSGLVTWFPADPAQLRGINMVPMNGGSLFYAEEAAYVRQAMQEIRAAMGGEPRDWKMAFWMYEALADPQSALASYQTDPDFPGGTGESRAYNLSWLKTLGSLGAVKADVRADSPYAAAFAKDGKMSYSAFNPGGETLTVTFTDGKVLQVAAHSLVTIDAAGARHVLDYADKGSIDRPADVPADLPIDPPEGELALVAEQDGLSLFMDRTTGHAWVQDGDNDPIALIRRDFGGRVDVKRTDPMGELNAIARGEDGKIMVLDTNKVANMHWGWVLDAQARYVGEVRYDGAAGVLAAELQFGVDVNGDGLVQTGALRTVRSNQGLDLVEDTGNGAAYIRSAEGGAIKYVAIVRSGDEPIKLEHDGWTLTSVGRDGDGRLRVLDTNPGNELRYAWILDEKGRWTGETTHTNKDAAAIEGVFNLDLDGDGVIADAPIRVIAANDGVRLLMDPKTGLALIETADGARITVKTGAAPEGVLLSRGGWSLSAVGVDDQGRIRVLDTAPGAEQRYAWILDDKGMWAGEQVFDKSTIKSAERLFGKDLDGDGEVSGAPLRVIEDTGEVTLWADSHSGKAFIVIGDGEPIALNREGWGAVSIERGPFRLLAAAQDDQGRLRVLDASPHEAQHYAWIVDDNGRFVGEEVFAGPGLKQAELLFELDLDGDKLVGPPVSPVAEPWLG
ncbi:glycosyl hydrolase [Caulobacter segnis]|uniref:glycosyl hydrolase n=1 Tax=Caulobacter segnis TaxID=88688 RepID=UPI0024104859|nr:glycosyl hydrolase [Caulobacter segnis]MDG2520473.1 glycosyl hydrolase [Caulobacter segnis]